MPSDTMHPITACRRAFLSAAALLLFALSGLSRAQTINYTDLWWNPNESGWGMQVTHHNDEMFATWFTYDEQGNQLFITLPGCSTVRWNGRTCSGELYRTTGSPYTGTFVRTNTIATRIGTGTLTFTSATAASFSYTINNTTLTKSLVRQAFGTGVSLFPFDRSDLYYVTGEDGWGFSLAQHGDAVFGVIYHYDENGRPMFVTLPSASFSDSVATGTLYRTRTNGNSHYLSSSWRAGDVSLAPSTGVGTARITLTTSGISINATINGISLVKDLVRQPFGAATPASALPPTSLTEKLCANPRAETRYGDKPGTVAQEKRWVRSYIDETYLWYGEVPNFLADNYASARTYFDVLKTPALTASGRAKDQFHFYDDTAAYEASQATGASFGYGITLAALSTSPPRVYVVALTQPGSVADLAGVQRGARILTVDGADLVSGNNIAVLNAGLFPTNANENHSFVIQDAGSTTTRTVTLRSGSVTNVPVQNVGTVETPTGRVGYILFNSFIFPSEGQLITAINQLRQQNIRDLVLDLRYNGGGLIYIASQLSYMIAGPTANNRIFEKLTFSDKRSSDNNDPSNTVPFYNVSSGFANTGTTTNASLPSLNLSRVYVLTSSGTASASESVINGLEGIGVQVIRIGGQTRGKPYGFTPKDNCGTTYFSIEFKGTNNVGFGDYADGFSPTCTVDDDFTRQLGDATEARFATALGHRATGTCTKNGVETKRASSLYGVATEHLLPQPYLFRAPSEEAKIRLRP